MLMPGDWVEVLEPSDVLGTLDRDGNVESMPFMPEMLPFCGTRFRVQVRAERTCARGLLPGARPLRRLEGCVVLEGLRCNGAAHGGCQLGCMLFWKESWLRPVAGPGPAGAQPRVAKGSAHLPVMNREDPNAYRCQGTELAKSTTPGPHPFVPWPYVRMLSVGTLGTGELVRMLGRTALRKLDRMMHGAGARPAAIKATAGEVLALERGELVQIKTKAEILATLDQQGRHRGLGFSNDMLDFCGRTLRVQGRVERILREENGKMIAVRDTVTLQGANCQRHLGCARQMPLLWREAWLRRAPPPRCP